jgi:hypothetical protein
VINHEADGARDEKDLQGNDDGRNADRRLANRLCRGSPTLQILLVASPRKSRSLSHTVTTTYKGV